MDLDALTLSPANSDHLRQIMSISQNVYGGQDYLCHCFHAWLADPQRTNVVLMDSRQKVLGFQSFLWLDTPEEGGRLRVLAQALRVDAALQGKGVGRRFMRMCRQMLLEDKEKVIEVKSVGSDMVDESKYADPSMGKVVCSKIELFFWVDRPNFAGNFEALSQFQEVSADKLAKVLFADASAKNRFLSNDYLTIMWVPHLIRHPTDLLQVRPYNSDISILVDSQESPQTLSILTLPFSATVGLNVGIDIFAQDEHSFRGIFLQHLQHLFLHMQEKRLTVPFHLWLGCQKKFFPFVRDFVQEALAFKRTLVPQWDESERKPVYFVYEKELSK